MNKKIKKQWVKELRSGEWAQANGRLCDNDDAMCCLGVLTDIAVRAGVVEPWEEIIPGSGAWRIPGVEKDEELLSDEVMDWAGLDNCNPAVAYNGLKTNLSSLNDGTYNGEYSVRLNFKEIADLIEAQL